MSATTVTRKMKVMGVTLESAVQDDGTVVNSGRLNVRSKDGMCEVHLVVTDDDIGKFVPGASVSMVLTLDSD